MIKNYKKGLGLSSSKGFTLIELLVVIAIIGILASVVLISTNATRARGNDSAIQANLGTVKLQAELVNISNKCYGDSAATTSECDSAFTPTGDCTDTMFSLADADGSTAKAGSTVFDPILTKALIAAIKASGKDSTTNVVECQVGGAGSQSYAVAVPMKTIPTDSWCVDSGGYSDTVLSSDQIAVDSTSGNVSCKPK